MDQLGVERGWPWERSRAVGRVGLSPNEEGSELASPTKRVLVTGATGQIGYMTFRRLLEWPSLYDVFGLDRKPEPSIRVPSSWQLELPGDRFSVCDLSDFDGVRQAVRILDADRGRVAKPVGGPERLAHLPS